MHIFHKGAWKSLSWIKRRSECEGRPFAESRFLTPSCYGRLVKLVWLRGRLPPLEENASEPYSSLARPPDLLGFLVRLKCGLKHKLRSLSAAGVCKIQPWLSWLRTSERTDITDPKAKSTQFSVSLPILSHSWLHLKLPLMNKRRNLGRIRNLRRLLFRALLTNARWANLNLFARALPILPPSPSLLIP